MEHKNGLMGRVTATYISDQFNDPFNSMEPTNNGREGLIPAFMLIDASMMYHVKKKINTRFHIVVKNLLNKRFIASRRPQGIMMGMPRFFKGGLTFNF